MSLVNWLANGWLVEHEAGRDEIANLLAIAERDLDQCALQELVPDWAHNIAYNSALQLATAALATRGYRASREAQHFRVLQSLSYTVGSDAKTIRRLDQARKRMPEVPRGRFYHSYRPATTRSRPERRGLPGLTRISTSLPRLVRNLNKRSVEKPFNLPLRTCDTFG